MSETYSPRRIRRSVFAVIVGIVANIILSSAPMRSFTLPMSTRLGELCVGYEGTFFSPLCIAPSTASSAAISRRVSLPFAPCCMP